VLEDPPPFEMLAANDEQALAFNKVWREYAAASKQKSIQELVEMSRQENPAWSEAERQPWAQAKQQFNLNAFDEETIDIKSGRQIMFQIICPTLIITADLDKNSAYPPQAADELVAKLPYARHINIPGAGHNIRREQPEAYLTAVREFLKMRS
jgi:pimeloyl-ACP methyl ester carboxylesterase